MYCTICKNWKQKTGKYCTHCGNDLKDDINFYGREFRKGNQEAFDCIFEISKNRVKREIRTYIAEDQVDDCLQMVYLKLYKNIHSFNEEKAGFNTWFQTLRKNEIITYYNSHKKEVQELYDDPMSMLENIESTDSFVMPEVSLEKKECARLIAEILNTLPQEQRICIEQYYMQGKKQKEIADNLGIQEGTVKSRLFNGKKSIKIAVLNLEKKGTKLYGLSPVFFFLWLLQNTEASAMHLSDISLKPDLFDPVIKEQIIQKEAIETAGFSGDGVGKAVAGKSVASMAAKVQGTKILFGVIGLSTVLGGGYAAVQFSQSRQSLEEDTSVVEMVEEQEASDELE